MNEKDFRAQVLEAFREESRELLQQADNRLQSLTESSEEAEKEGALVELKRILHTLKGAASAVGEEDYAKFVHNWEEDLVAAQKTPGWTIDQSLADSFERLEELHGRIFNEEPRSPETSAPLATPQENEATASAASNQESATVVLSENVRVKVERIDTLDALLGDLTVLRLQDERSVNRLNQTRKTLAKSMSSYRQLRTALRKLKRQAPSSDVLQSFIQNFEQMGEQLHHAYKDCYSISREIPANLDQERSLISNIVDNIRDLRLMPLQSFFEEYQKVARQAARQCGKSVKLKIVSKGAEVDRPVLVKLRDPLLHLIRNAVVHGIESPAERRLSGKPEVGTILLEGFCEGGRATIRVSDDGRGLNEEDIHRRGVQLNVVSSTRELSKQSVLDILTSPGFSTKSQTDVLAGRGIGLDVVGARLQELDGYLDYESLQGLGCSFSMNVPVSTSSNVALILTCSDQQFCIVLDHIECVVRISEQSLSNIEGREVVEVNDRPVAVVTLTDILGLGAFSFKGAKKPALVLKMGDRRLALLVDDIPGEQVVVIKTLGPAFEGIPMFMGGAIQSDHQIIPVIQVTELFRRAAGAQVSLLSSISERAAGSSKKAILVVDDSITMRTLERNILQAAGYQVTVAHDGQHALEVLTQSGSFDAIVTDIQMPQIDGLELCRRVRQSATPDLPILVVTSLNTEDEKKRALNAGADAYIMKSQFEQNSFLECIRRLSGNID